MQKVTVRQEAVIIPTYEAAACDKNPMFLEKRVYQGSSGRVYPHPVCESVANEKTDREYHAIFLENEYLLVMILPELGGRIQRLYDKTNGYDAIYYNEVVKPALVGLAGPWISGGIEFNWPQHHRPSTFDPVDYTIEEQPDGSVTVWTGETEKMFHTKGMAGFTLYPGRAYLEIRGQLYNPTDRPQTFLWWANPAVAVNDNTQSIFPPDVHAVMDHGKRDVSAFPIATGTYYKYDYSRGVDISRYKNIPVPTSYMAYHSDYDFIGNYDYGRKAGLLHVADHHISPGKKQWTWGNGDFGKAWDRNLTDENGPYIELMTGMFTDNQPDFTFLKPYEEKCFVQYFMPYKEAGAVKNASSEIVLNLEREPDGSWRSTVYSPVEADSVTIELLCQGAPVFRETVSLSPLQLFTRSATSPAEDETLLTLRVWKDGRELLSYTPSGDSSEPIPAPAEALPAPEQLDSTEKLFLAATHLEQYRHATRSPEDYYLEGLKRDPGDIRLNNGYGKYLYHKGRFAESESFFRAAIKRSVWKNPNPYDCEPYYNLGLALRRLNRPEEAFDAFYKAVWDGSMQDRAFYQLACLEAAKGRLAEALGFAEQSLVRGLHNRRARNLKTALLRLLGRTGEAARFAEESRQLDPLEHGCRYELYLLSQNPSDLQSFRTLLRGDSHSYIELAQSYMEAGLRSQAAQALKLAAESRDPMLHYYLYACTGEKQELMLAEQCPSLYCFPNRLEDIAVLEQASEDGGRHAAYYLGCLLYDRGRWQEAVRLWEDCLTAVTLPTVYRNLSLAYYNKLQDAQKAVRAMEQAFAMDESDSRVFFELDQLYRLLGHTPESRLAHMEAHKALLSSRDDLYTEYITLLNLNRRYEKAFHSIMTHSFHPWEGGEGKIPAQYRSALIHLAEAESDSAEVIRLLVQALSYPVNLGEGKLAGAMDNDIYYLLGKQYQKNSDEERARQSFAMAARGSHSLSSAVYYNDQPPEMMYYAALALKELGQSEEADARFDSFLRYGREHLEDQPEIDYFAVSLPDFLIFDSDLAKNNRVHCYLMLALGSLGKGDTAAAHSYAEEGLKLQPCHQLLLEIKEGFICLQAVN